MPLLDACLEKVLFHKIEIWIQPIVSFFFSLRISDW